MCDEQIPLLIAEHSEFLGPARKKAREWIRGSVLLPCAESRLRGIHEEVLFYRIRMDRI